MNAHELNALGGQQRRVLEIVWQRNGATVHDVLAELNANTDTPLAYTTVLATMQKLEKTGWLTHEPAPDNCRTYLYKATRSRSGAIGDALRKFADTFLGGSKTLLFQHFVDDTGLNEDELAEIRKMIAEKKERSQNL
ncbi:MAG: BlaI/MecI/CopY family transcriptional regulator [Planctomycetaceae bacterium]|nr:BlaI/MecI/CopY family transcriptional regulator [Planctomycetaceae bacterium]